MNNKILNLYIVWGILITALIVTIYYSLGWQTDDSFIYRLFSRNFIEKQVFSWDKSATVNDYSVSSFLYGIVVSTLMLISTENIAKLEILFNILIFLISLFSICRKNLNSKDDKLLLLLALISSPYPISWQFFGLETGLYISLNLLLFFQIKDFVLHNKNPPNKIVLLILSILRPEGIIYILLVICIFVIKNKKLKYFVLPITFFIVYHLICFLILNDIFPSSYYWKIGAVSKIELLKKGVIYLIDFLLSSAFIPLIFIILIFYSYFKSLNKKNDFENIILILYIFAIITPAILNGGDWMINARFFSHAIIPFYFLCFKILSNKFIHRIKDLNTILLTLSLIIFCASSGIFKNIAIKIYDEERNKNNRNTLELLILNRGERSFNPDNFLDESYLDLINYINENDNIKHIGISEAGYIPYKIIKKASDYQGLTLPKLSKIVDNYGRYSNEHFQYLIDRNISHFIFWFESNNSKPRVGTKIHDYFFESKCECLYEKKVFDDVYRYIINKEMPAKVCVLENPFYKKKF